ncbi:mitochondrial 54S ribosomal protein bL31m Ecym_3445 [Eremothecium cymbalariae DBVPG|uniref:Ribosomal protein bL31m N-terminal domain-containing protein n=1 Tax=Eremothecium cymbalariae (strain CBS 270.75 / DBVPG 7215 / KCTC 17166 / NRRL Y-17582) TaxID=931890 RepID=G8JS11_ERECY|nr:Hypothetical protein Ecym_3445 [Eremothecium cymbalariae DBVPG\
MFRFIAVKRFASTGGYHGSNQISLPRRPLKKIRLGKSRPAIYYQFDVKVELSDGSVITRRSQIPKDQIRLIQDQRNNPLWNESRTDLMVVDANAGGRMEKFKQKYGSIYTVAQGSKVDEAEASESVSAASEPSKEESEEFGMDDYLSLLSENAVQVQSGGKLATKKKKAKK